MSKRIALIHATPVAMQLALLPSTTVSLPKRYRAYPLRHRHANAILQGAGAPWGSADDWQQGLDES
jgi:hypothetical protein